MTGIFIPQGYQRTGRIDLIVFLRGHNVGRPSQSFADFWRQRTPSSARCKASLRNHNAMRTVFGNLGFDCMYIAATTSSGPIGLPGVPTGPFTSIIFPAGLGGNLRRFLRFPTHGESP